MAKKLLFIMLVALSVAAFPVISGADLGNFNNYSSDSDTGGWSSSGSDWGNSYGGGYGRGYGYGGYGGYGGYSGYAPTPVTGGDILCGLIGFAVIIALFAIFSRKMLINRTDTGMVRQGYNIQVPDYTEAIVAEIHKTDPDFSYEKFIGWVKEVFITLQNAWSARDFEKCRPFEKEELYAQHVAQIQDYKNRGLINRLDRINVNQSYLFKYTTDTQYEYLTVYIQSRMSDYIIEEKTGNVVKGSPDLEYEMKYLYTFIRKTGVLTDPAKSNNSVVACPHCGAPTQITSAGKCEYCGFIVTTGEYDWVLSNIEAIHNETGIGSGGVINR